ncbi:MAG: molybdopterin-dependent oxidoreductase, partial [Nitrospinaceae bacterium]|nr:molybdopterin-dependent oxidoreductase [Nitrospinaceae bacterium]
NARVKEAQESVFEVLLKNHPLDCPVCDQGGECPLQDQTLGYAKAVSRTHELRRIYPKNEISPFIKPEMNRCVHCTRCIRFTSEIDGGSEFGWANRGDRTEVGVFADLPLTSIVSGNVIDICPVGALTDNKYRFTARVWEMKEVEGPCTLCSVGCQQKVWNREGELKRVTAGDNPEVNDTWICDVGRWGWSGVQNESRIKSPMIRENGELRPASWEEAQGLIARRFSAIRTESGGAALAGLGGGRSTNETAFQFGALFRTVLESANIDCRINPRDMRQTEAQRAGLGAVGGHGSLTGLASAKSILLIGSDPFEEHPVLALRARAAHSAGGSIVSVHPRRIDLRVLGRIHHLTPIPGEEARALSALARLLLDAGASPKGGGADAARGGLAGLDVDALCRESALDTTDLADAAGALRPDEGGVCVVVGPGLKDEAAITEAVNIALMLDAEILFASGAANLQGALDMGLHPALLPGSRSVDEASAQSACAEVWGGEALGTGGQGADDILAGAAEKKIRGLYLLECDPVAEHSEGALARRALEGAEFVVVHASHRGASVEYADVVLPALTLYEEEGTVTNIERRAQRLRRAVKPQGSGSKEAWRVLSEIARLLEHPLKANDLAGIQAQIRLLAEEYAPAFGKAPEAGVLLSRERKGNSQPVAHEPTNPPPAGLQMILAPALWLSGSLIASADHLSGMPEAALRISPTDAERLGVSDGAAVSFEVGGKSVALPVQVDPTIPVGVAQAPEGYLAALEGAVLNLGGDEGAGTVIQVSIAEAVRA